MHRETERQQTTLEHYTIISPSKTPTPAPRHRPSALSILLSHGCVCAIQNRQSMNESINQFNQMIFAFNRCFVQRLASGNAVQ